MIIVLIELGFVSSGIVSGMIVMLFFSLVLWCFFGVDWVLLICVFSMLIVISSMMILLFILSDLIEMLKKLMICCLSSVVIVIMQNIDIDVIWIVCCCLLFVCCVVRFRKNGIVFIGLISVSSEMNDLSRFIVSWCCVLKL